MRKLLGNHHPSSQRHVDEFEAVATNCMKKLFRPTCIPLYLLIFSMLTSCIDTGDEERPGIRVSADYLATKVWGIEQFKDDGQDKSQLFQEVFVEFRHNFLFRVTHGCETIEGEWILSNDSTLLVVRIPDAMEPLNQLADEWVVKWLNDTEMHLIEQDNKGDEEFYLKVAPLNSLNCQNCEHITDQLTENPWSVTSLVGNLGDVTEEIRGAYFEFNTDGTVTLFTDQYETNGTWAVTDQCQQLAVEWNQGQVYPDIFQQIADSWSIGGLLPEVFNLENGSNGKLELSQGISPNCDELYVDLQNTSWYVDFVSINQDDVSDNFRGTGFTLLENNQLATEVMVGPAVLGKWLLDGHCDHLSLEIQSGQLKELARNWIIVDASNDSINLVFEEGAISMELRLKRGTPEPSQNCLDIISLLTQGEWSVVKSTSTKPEEEPLSDGYTFRLNPDGTLVISLQDQHTYGCWHLIGDCNQVLLDFDPKSAFANYSGKWELETADKSITIKSEKMQVKRTVELTNE